MSGQVVYFPTQHDATLKKVFQDLGDEGLIKPDDTLAQRGQKLLKGDYNEYTYVPQIDTIVRNIDWRHIEPRMIHITNLDGMRDRKVRSFTVGAMKGNDTLWQVNPDDIEGNRDYYDSVLETDGYVGGIMYSTSYIPLVLKGYKETDPLSERAKHYQRVYLAIDVNKVNKMLEGDQLPFPDIFTFTDISNIPQRWKLESFLTREQLDRLAFPKKYTANNSIICNGGFVTYKYVKEYMHLVCLRPEDAREWRDMWVLGRKKGALYPGSPSSVPSPISLSHVRGKLLKEDGVVNDRGKFNKVIVEQVQSDKTYWIELLTKRVERSVPILKKWLEGWMETQTPAELKVKEKFIPYAVKDVTRWEKEILVTYEKSNPSRYKRLVGINPHATTNEGKWKYLIDIMKLDGREMAITEDIDMFTYEDENGYLWGSHPIGEFGQLRKMYGKLMKI